MGTPANHYLIVGSGIEGTIDTSSITGTPVVSIEVDGNQLNDPSLEDTAHGFQVTAIVEAIPDLSTTCLRLLVPHVNVDAEPVAYAGVALLITSRTSIGGPTLVNGVIDTYEVRPLGGTADAVQF